MGWRAHRHDGTTLLPAMLILPNTVVNTPECVPYFGAGIAAVRRAAAATVGVREGSQCVRQTNVLLPQQI